MKQNLKSIAAVSTGIGIVLLGLFIFLALGNFKDADRVVSVRGLSEREVKADMVLWPVVYMQTGYNLNEIYREIELKNNKVLKFLGDAGFTSDEYIVNAATIVDLDAERYSSNDRNYRYIATQVITVNTSKVDRVVELQLKQNELMREGIALNTDSYQYRTEFLFTGLNEIKPEMIQEATNNAREAAEKFAQDSGSKVGAISRATQGQFSINDRDNYTPQIKKVRVVTSVVYSLD